MTENSTDCKSNHELTNQPYESDRFERLYDDDGVWNYIPYKYLALWFWQHEDWRLK